MKKMLLALVVFGAGCIKPESQAENHPSDEPRPLSLAAAADLRYALDEVLSTFHADHPDLRAVVTYGSSGNLHSQIESGAPFDMFLSADIRYAERIAEHGLAAGDGVFPYARGFLAVWVPRDSQLDPEGDEIQVLLDERVRKVAIANPQHAPYGRAAEAALRHYGMYDVVAPRFVFGENIAQAAQFVESGGADVGILALSLVVAPSMKEKGRYWPIPPEAYPPLEQGGVILTRCADRPAADTFRQYLTGRSGREILTRYGFEPVAGQTRRESHSQPDHERR